MKKNKIRNILKYIALTGLILILIFIYSKNKTHYTTYVLPENFTGNLYVMYNSEAKDCFRSNDSIVFEITEKGIYKCDCRTRGTYIFKIFTKNSEGKLYEVTRYSKDNINQDSIYYFVPEIHSFNSEGQKIYYKLITVGNLNQADSLMEIRNKNVFNHPDW